MGVPPVGVPKVKAPLFNPQVALVVVVVMADGPGELVKVGEIVNVHPKLLVNVIIGELAASPVTVCPLTVPKLLVYVEIVWAGNAGEVLFIKITPLLNPQVGFVKVTVAVGFGLMTTLTVPEDTHPIVLVPVTL